jgi:hypothetical protein
MLPVSRPAHQGVGKDQRGFAAEAFASYSHKLPLADLHVRAVWCSASGNLSSCKDSARISLSSNKLRNTMLVLIETVRERPRWNSVQATHRRQTA